VISTLLGACGQRADHVGDQHVGQRTLREAPCAPGDRLGLGQPDPDSAGSAEPASPAEHDRVPALRGGTTPAGSIVDGQTRHPHLAHTSQPPTSRRGRKRSAPRKDVPQSLRARPDAGCPRWRERQHGRVAVRVLDDGAVVEVVQVCDAADPRPVISATCHGPIAVPPPRWPRPRPCRGHVVVRRRWTPSFPPQAHCSASPAGVAGPRARAGRLRRPAYVTDADTMARVVGFHLNRGGAGQRRSRTRARLDALLAGARRVACSWASAIPRTSAPCSATPRRSGRLGAGRPGMRRPPLPAQRPRLDGPRAAGAFVPVEWPAAVSALHGAGFTLAALHPGGDRGPAGLAGTDRLALVLGAEDPGSRRRRSTPRTSPCDSHERWRRLAHVATAAAVAFHAVVVGARGARPDRSVAVRGSIR